MLGASPLQTLVIEPVLFAALAGLSFAPLEHLFAARASARQKFVADLWFASAGQLLLQLLLTLVVGQLLARLEPFALERTLSSQLVSESWQTACDVALGIVLFELLGYVYHRLAHGVPWLWRLHAVHHSSETMDWLAAFRQHPLEIALVTLVQNAPLVLLGIPLGSHALVLLLLKVNTVFVHANVRVPTQLAWLLATPAFHHRHHQCEGAAKNFASLFPWIDRAFGSFSAEPAQRFGVSRPIADSFVGLLVHPIRRRD